MKKTIIAVLAVAGLWAFWHFYEVKGAAGRKDKEAQGKRLLASFNKDAVTGIEIKAAGQPELRLSKGPQGWLLEAPFAAAGDASQIDLLLTNARDIERQELIAEKPTAAELAQFGLGTASDSATFHGLSGAVHCLVFGSPNPMGQSVYCQVSGSPQVLLAAAYSKEGILRKADQLRDKAVWALDTAKVVKVRSTLKDASFSIAKSADGSWVLETAGGKKVQASESKVSDILAQLAHLQIRDFIADNPKSLGAYKMGAPKERIEVLEAGSKDLKVLLHGGASAALGVDNYMVKGRPLVFTLEKHYFTSLGTASKELADKSAFKVKPFDVAKVVVETPGNTGTSFTAEKKADTWARTQGTPLAKGASADMLGLLSSLAQAQSQGTAAKPVTAPEARVKLYDAKGAQLEEADFYGLDAKTGTRLAFSTALARVSKVPESLYQSIPR